jgi:uncharacterized protein (TIGR00369 family)
VRSLERGRCSLLVPRRAEWWATPGAARCTGGVISMLVDTCGGFAVWTMGQPSDRIATIDLRVDYLKPAMEGDLVAESQVRLHGNRVGNAVTVVYCSTDPGTIVAEGRSVYNIRRA